MDIVSDSKLALGGRVGAVDSCAEVVLSNLDLFASELVVVIGVQVEVRNNIAERLQDILANSVARRVGRTHVGGVFADDVADSHLVLDHLVVDLSLGDGGKILVGPSVGCDLVALGDHALDNSVPLFVNSTLANVVTSNEEGGLESGSSKLVKDLVSVDVWAVIVGNGYSSGLAASVNTRTTIRNIALDGASIVASGGSSRSLVSITARAEVEQAIRGVAVIRSVSTISLCNSKLIVR